MRIAVVGLGFMGGTHARAIRRIAGAELAAIVSSDPEKTVEGNLGRADEALDLTGVRVYRRLEQALDDPSIDAVDICLPTWLHEEAALSALAAGKHVLVEKPMALDGAGCERMIEAAGKAGRILMTAQVLRFWPEYQPLLEANRSGRFGRVHAAFFRRRCAAPAWGGWLHDPARSGGGVFDLLIHDVDLCIHLFGLPEAVSATGSENLAAGIDVITAELYYPAIPSVVITGGWHHPAAYPFSMEYTVVYEAGTLDFSSIDRRPTIYDEAGHASPLAVPPTDGFDRELEYFSACAAAGTFPSVCPPGESAAAVRLTRLLTEARGRKGERLPCNL